MKPPTPQPQLKLCLTPKGPCAPVPLGHPLVVIGLLLIGVAAIDHALS